MLIKAACDISSTLIHFAQSLYSNTYTNPESHSNIHVTHNHFLLTCIGCYDINDAETFKGRKLYSLIF